MPAGAPGFISILVRSVVHCFPLFAWCWGWGKGVHTVNTMHGRSRMRIDSRTPTTPGRSTSGFHRPGRHCSCAKREAPPVVRASRVKGELHPTTRGEAATFVTLAA